MECTQRLQCTQELYETHSERVCPEQIGFLGILGTKHPVLRGPNKIGRDPQTCSIVLNLNSVSRQHAVINILNSKEFMLMDLDSANKTKVLNKTLQPYIPHPLRNGDTVQFGDVFGIFRLLEEDDDLPMTQAIDIPETPLPSKPVSKLNKAPTTLIPESPDVSDRDDSFATPSKTTGEKSKLSNSQFINSFGKTISIHPVSSPKTDTSRNSSKKLSFVSNPDTSLNESVDKHARDIHDMDTQPPNHVVNESTESIYTADTQMPLESSPSIHSLNTQPLTTEHLPQVRKIDNQKEMQFDIYAANKENDISIFNAETQPLAYMPPETAKSSSSNVKVNTSDALRKGDSKEKLNKSEEELLFDEIDGECFEEDFNSQNLLPDELPFKEGAEEKIAREKSDKVPSKRNTRIQSDSSTDCEDIDIIPTQKVQTLPVSKKMAQAKGKGNSNAAQRNVRIKSDSSTDCEDDDIMPTQVVPELPSTKNNKQHVNMISKANNGIQSDDSTDCEDIDIVPTQKIPEKKDDADDDVTDCEDDTVDTKTSKPASTSTRIEDMATQIIDVNNYKVPLEDMPTQIIDVDHYKGKNLAFEDMPTQIIDVDHYKGNKPAIEDMPTQIIDTVQCKVDKPALEDMPTQIIDLASTSNNSDNISFEDQATQITDEVTPSVNECAKKQLDDTMSPFKIPLQSPIRIKSKDIPKILIKNKTPENKQDDNYYEATQDIYEDLCSQREPSPEILRVGDDDVVPCSVEDYKAGDRFANIEKEIINDEKVTDYVTNLSSQEVREVIGAEAKVVKLKRIPSDSSDVDATPKKIRPALFTDSDLPSSQEIKNSVVSHTDTTITEFSSESETENFSEELTPFVHRKKKLKTVTKIDLTKKFDVENLPERVLTRQRKPTSKLLASTEIDKKCSANILRPKYLVEQEDQIDEDIISENIKRLKSYEKVKESKKESPPQQKAVSVCKNQETDVKAIKKESPPHKKTQPISKNQEIPKETKKGSPPEKSTESRRKNEEIHKENKKDLPQKKTRPASKSPEIIKLGKKESPPQKLAQSKSKTTETRSKTEEMVKEIKRESPRLKTMNSKSKETKEKIKVKIEKPKKKDSKSKRDSRRSSHDKEKSDELTSDSRTTRQTRGQKRESGTRQTEKQSTSLESNKKVPEEENNKKERDNKRKRTNNKKERSKSPEIEIRRSKRQQNTKDKPVKTSKGKSVQESEPVVLVEAVKMPKSILKKNVHEQSTVYNVSSSSTESPRNLKRSMTDDVDIPSPKRTKSGLNNTNSSVSTNESISNASLRATPARILRAQRVLFTAFPCEEVKVKLEKLGAVVVTNVLECTVVLTREIRRTFKLLCAIGLGKPIVGPNWVQACVDTKMIVDPWLYLMKDEANEKRFKFNLQKTLAGKRNFLKGYNVSSTPNTQPNASELKMIVECSGGTWKEGGSNWICVSSTKDTALWPALRKRGAVIVSTEFILSGVLRQQVDVDSCKYP